MLGNLLHPPNFESVKFVKKHVWPIIKKEMPEAQIHIYGAYTSQKVQQFHNKKEGFLIMGRAESASDVLKNARVLLSPLLYGAGLKTKFIKFEIILVKNINFTFLAQLLMLNMVII